MLWNKLVGSGVLAPHPWDIRYAKYDGVFDPGLAVNVSIFFKPDGTKMWLSNNSTTDDTLDGIYQYSLSTPWDITTASYDNKKLSTYTISSSPGGIWFNNSGTKIFLIGPIGPPAKFDSWTLTTPWDISTAGSYNAGVSTGDTGSIGLHMNSDLTKIYISGNQNDVVRQFSMSGEDVDNISFVGSFSVAGEGTAPRGVALNDDGTRMWVSDNGLDGITQYALSTPWDVTTAAADGVFLNTAADGETGPYDFFFGDNGRRLFLTGFANKVTQYRL